MQYIVVKNEDIDGNILYVEDNQLDISTINV